MQAGLGAARLGAGLSVVLLGIAVWLRVALAVSDGCYTRSGGSGGPNPILFVVALVALAALILDIQALRRGPRESFWGRVGLTLFAVAAIVLGWWFVVGLDQLLSCAG